MAQNNKKRHEMNELFPLWQEEIRDRGESSEGRAAERLCRVLLRMRSRTVIYVLGSAAKCGNKMGAGAGINFAD